MTSGKYIPGLLKKLEWKKQWQHMAIVKGKWIDEMVLDPATGKHVKTGESVQIRLMTGLKEKQQTLLRIIFPITISFRTLLKAHVNYL